MYTSVFSSVLEKYGLEYSHIYPMQKGYRNESYPVMLKGGQKINIIFYKREPNILERIKRADHVSNYLAQNGIPTRQTYDARILQLRSGNYTTLIAMYIYLPGKTIPWEAYTKGHIKLIGKTMSDMHYAMHKLEISNMPNVVDEYCALGKEMLHYFIDPGVKVAMIKKLKLSIDLSQIQNLVMLLDKTKNLPNQQILHMDFVRGNILFNTTDNQLEVSGIIDFEKTAVGHPLFDIARTLAFLIVDCKYKSSAKVYQYFLYSGYHKRGQSKLPLVTIKANNQSYDLLNSLVMFFMCHDLYKFLLHNPYESLHLNEHYIRTRDALIEYGVVHYNK